MLPQYLPWAGIFPPQAVPVLLYPFHQKVLFLLPESFLLQVEPVPTQPWQFSVSLSLQQPFMHFTLALFLS